MIEVNLLLGITGKASNSFVVLDLMRLPLGILSGMGFIGAGAIIRRGNMVHGVTTAATLWFVTVLGLCLGGGQIAVGLLALALGLFVLWCLKWFENRMHQDRAAQLLLMVDGSGPHDEDVRRALGDNHYQVTPGTVVYLEGGETRETTYRVRWRARNDVPPEPSALSALAQATGVRRLEWRPE
jgi:putative Mg2+ transporter-C (MgtC) family protein